MMDAVKFVEGYSRICGYHHHCYECPLKNEPCTMVSVSPEDAEDIVAIVEKWVEEHPEDRA